MPTATSVLDDHTVLRYRSLDRMMLNAYLPLLQTPGAVVRFLQRDGPVPSPALLQRRGDRFVRELRAYAEAHGAPWIVFARKEDKEERMRPLFERAEREGRFGLVAVGVGQERTRGWRARKVGAGGAVSFDYSRQAVFVSHYYLYLRDEQWGRSFIAFSSYAPWGLRIHLNGHNWLRRQLERRNVGYEPLDNGLRSCADPALAERLAAALGPAEVRAYFARWLAELPQPLTPGDRAAGYGYALSMAQLEVSDTAVLDRPRRARQWFETMLPELLATGRPQEISLLFGRRLMRSGPRRTPGRFQTEVVSPFTLPVIRFRYKSCVVKQYLKAGIALRTETTFWNSYDVDIGRRLENLPALRAKGDEINARLLANESGIERAQLSGPELSELVLPTRAAGRRVAALRFGDPRVMALLAALVAIAHLALGFSNAQLRRIVADLLAGTAGEYTAARMTYDLGRLVAHGLIARLPRTHRYRLTPFGLRVAAVCTKLHDRVLDPAIARSRASPPSPARTAWRRLEAALDAVLESAHLAA